VDGEKELGREIERGRGRHDGSPRLRRWLSPRMTGRHLRWRAAGHPNEDVRAGILGTMRLWLRTRPEEG